MREHIGRVVELCGNVAEWIRWLADRASGIWVIGNWIEDRLYWIADAVIDIGIAFWAFADALWKFEEATGEKVNWWDVPDLVRVVWPWLDTIDDRIREVVSALIPALPDIPSMIQDFFENTVKPWVESLIPTDIVRPWEVWDLIADKVKELIPEIEIPEIPDFDWLVEKIEDAMVLFLEKASWPFLHALEAFLNRIWWEEE